MKTHQELKRHTGGTGAGYCDLCVCMCFSWRRVFLCLCVSVSGQRLMRYEWVSPSSVVFLRVAVKVNFGTRERVHGWGRQGNVRPTCPIWFRAFCSTLHLLFLSNLCTWVEKEEEVQTCLQKSENPLHTNTSPHWDHTHTQLCHEKLSSIFLFHLNFFFHLVLVISPFCTLTAH